MWVNISRLGPWGIEAVSSEKGFATVVEQRPIFLNVNDRFSKDPAEFAQ